MSSIANNWIRYLSVEHQQIIAPRPIHIFSRYIVSNLQAQVLALAMPLEISAPVAVSAVAGLDRATNDFETSVDAPSVNMHPVHHTADDYDASTPSASDDSAVDQEEDLRAYIRASLFAAMDDDSDLVTPPTSDREALAFTTTKFAWGARLPSDFADGTDGREFHAPRQEAMEDEVDNMLGLSGMKQVDGRDEVASVAGWDDEDDIATSVTDSDSAATESSEEDETEHGSASGYDADTEADIGDDAFHVPEADVMFNNLISGSGFWVAGTRY